MRLGRMGQISIALDVTRAGLNAHFSATFLGRKVGPARPRNVAIHHEDINGYLHDDALSQARLTKTSSHAEWNAKLHAIEIHAAMATKHSELLTDDVYSRLRDMIVSSILQPGQKLVDRDLAARLGVSRTPVREALGRLAMIGLVEARTRRGYYVTQFSTKQVADLYEFREMLEVQAVKLAIRNAQPSHLLEFDSILGDLEKLTPNPIDHASAVKLDLRIHELIARASGNHSLHQAMLNVLDKVMCFISVEIADKDALAAAHRQHQAILSKIKEKDAEAAAELISSHVESALESLIEVFRARDEIRNAVLAATPLKKGESDQRAADIETQLGGTS